MSRAVEESNRAMLRARDAMDRAYAEPLDIPALARIALVSEAHFIRTFRATFGETPHRYLQRRRVERAMALLRGVGPGRDGHLLRRRLRQPGHVQPYVPADRRGVALGFPAAPRRGGQRAVVLRQSVDPTQQFWISRRSRSTSSVMGMTMNAISRSQIYVLDQDAALDFYVNKLGMEVNTDQDLGFMRWLTVNLPGDPEREILLEKPGPPALDPATAEQVRELLTKGALGGYLFMTTDDARKTHEDLVAKGVEITDEPTERPYGIDFGIRDPFGNRIRIGQMFPRA